VPRTLSERDICSKFILPAITAAGWDLHTQIREEVTFYGFETKSSHLLGEVMRFSDKTRRLDNLTFHVF
jgi:type I restriction enzyme R subunit